MPPQSTSVSPFAGSKLTLAQAAGEQVPSRHNSGVAQSSSMRQPLPIGQVNPSFSAQLPPQSTPVSSPFSTVSLHDGGWHVPLVQTPLAQSLGFSQLLTVPQPTHSGPPQSTPVSLPFRRPSAHVALRQRRVTKSHACVAQS
jgi:hypothetical protein